jgi:hypothetical protein
MKQIIIMIFVLSFSSAFAKGVSAGTVIQNRATLSFSLEGDTFNIKSNIEKSIVAQLVDVKVSSLDTRAIIATLGDRDKVLTFKVLNSGNAKDSFVLFAQELNFKSDFSLDDKRIYLDTNDNYRFDLSDRLAKRVTLDEDEEQLVFIVSNVSDSLDVANGSQNHVTLKASSLTGGSGKRGKVYIGKGIKGVDVVDGFSGGVSEDDGSYKLLIANVILDKNVGIDDDELITVTIIVTIGGEGSVKDVNIVDEIPDETIYVNSTLMLDGREISDQKDSDAGHYKRGSKSRKAQILISLGDLEESSYHTISYNLKIRKGKK